jgi:xanthine dehydrogenase YagR molybdenum-binding subunit
MSIVEDGKALAQGLVQGAMAKVVALAPDSWIPGNDPDPMIRERHGHVGKPVSRLDGPQKVTGTAPFAAEIAMEGMVYAALAYSTIAKGRIVEIDTAEAEAAPGVVLVMTHRNAPEMKPTPVFLTSSKAAGGDRLPILQDDRIHWNGQPIALVLAETQEQADHAKSLIQTRYAQDRALTSLAEAKARGTMPSQFQGQPLRNEIGDAERALRDAPVKVDVDFSTPRHNHNPIELHAVTLAWQDDTLRIHDAQQGLAHVAWTLAQVFEMPEDKVIVTSPFVGGGFGSKTLWPHHIIAAAGARLIGRPVRLVLSREGVYRIVGGRSPTEQRVALGAEKDGALTALIHTGITAKTAHNALPEPFILPSRSAYACPNMLLETRQVELDMVGNTFMRAPGESVGTFALEVAMDELAEKLGIDPIELRLRNEPEEDPVKGLPFSARHIVEAWRAGAERFGWKDRSPEPGTRREGEWLVGMGCATGTYPYYRMPGGAARVTLTRNDDAPGGAGVLAGVDLAVHEMGMGTATVQTQVTAQRLGLPMEALQFNYGDSTLPGVILAGGSQQTAAIGASVIAAVNALVKELAKHIGNDSPLAGLGANKLGIRDAGLCALDDETLHESFASILARSQQASVSVEAEPSMPFELMHWSMHSHAAMFCEVRVNAITGEPRVSRFLGSFDCGRILNPKTATSQFRGGIIMGLGLALMEDTQFDERTGRIMNPSLAEYHVPVHMDVPEIDVIWTDIPDPHSPMGAREIGEIGITGTGAAVANAIYNATGKRVRDLPITLDKLL